MPTFSLKLSLYSSTKLKLLILLIDQTSCFLLFTHNPCIESLYTLKHFCLLIINESFNGTDTRNNKKTRPPVISCLSYITSSRGFYGGGDGCRTRVRKERHLSFSECSLCFDIPSGARP